jgi:hypothetical protein
MSPLVATEDLIDAHEVAEILGLNLRNTVSVYQQRYPDMPRPVVDLGRGRPKLWLRPPVQTWADRQRVAGRTRPARRVSQG